MGARRLRVRGCAPMRGSGESGGAAVEAAIILPALLVLLLCAIQIAQLQQARVMAEYAAFNAARAGIVQNGNNGADGTSGPMHDAAVLSILPTFRAHPRQRAPLQGHRRLGQDPCSTTRTTRCKKRAPT